MSLASLLAQTVTVRNYAEVGGDRYGNAVPTWSDPGTTYPARLEQTGSSETGGDRRAVVSEWRLFLPADAVIGARDHVVDSDDRTFEVLGAPAKAVKPRRVSHIVARLRYVEG